MGRNMALEQARHLHAPFISLSFQVAVLVYAQMAAVEEGEQEQEQEQGLYASRSFTYHAAVADVVRGEGKRKADSATGGGGDAEEDRRHKQRVQPGRGGELPLHRRGNTQDQVMAANRPWSTVPYWGRPYLPMTFPP